MLASTAVVADSARGSDRANAPRNVGHLRAEDIPAVDIVSKGRFDLGIGFGSQMGEVLGDHRTLPA